nr:hypothetical protein [Tanacetum cinerariifolium]
MTMTMMKRKRLLRMIKRPKRRVKEAMNLERGEVKVKKKKKQVKRKSDEGVESIFTTTSSQSVSLVPSTPIMTPSTIATITTSGEAQIPPPTIPSIILENLPTFHSAFCNTLNFQATLAEGSI